LTVEAWLQALPKETLSSKPWLLFWSGVCCQFTAPKLAGDHLHAAYRLFKQRDDLQGGIHAWIAYCDISSVFPQLLQRWRALLVDIEQWIEADPQARTPEEELRLTSALCLAALYCRPDHPKLHSWATHTRELLQQVLLYGSVAARSGPLLMSAGHLMLYYSWVGDWMKADNLLLELRDTFTGDGAPILARIMYLGFTSSNLWLAGETDRAIATVAEAMALSESSGIHVWDFCAMAQSIFAHLVAGNITTAKAQIRETRSKAPPRNAFEEALYSYLRLLVELHSGNTPIEEAKATLQQAVLIDIPWIVALARLVLVQAYIMAGDVEAARTHLGPCTQFGDRMNSRSMRAFCAYSATEIELLAQNEADALQHLRTALGLCRYILITVRQNPAVNTAQGIFACAGQCRVINDQVRLIGGGHGQSIREHHATFGIGVDDFDRGAIACTHHIVGFVGTGADVIGRECEPAVNREIDVQTRECQEGA
jgi:hypothetical protein